MNLSVTRATAALDDPEAVETLLAPLPNPLLVRGNLANITGAARPLVQYDERAETLHYCASDGKHAVRLSVAGVPHQHAASAILATYDVLNTSAKAVGVRLTKLLILPAHMHPATEAAPPLPHPEVRESLRLVPVALVPTL